MKRQPAVRKWGEFDDERCPVCGKFVSDGDAYYDREKREDEDSRLLRFCSDGHAEAFHADKRNPVLNT
jgi:hypothetical protein